jgi:hypothetical protein
MAMEEYNHLTKDELEWADHCFDSGNFEGLAKMQKISAERAGKSTSHINSYSILTSHTIKTTTG